jgi:cytochrome c-type biogenesis protein CcmH/NrfG
LQEALVLESPGELAAAAAAARAATERESTNWRTWLVLSRIEAELGDASAAVRDYHQARLLNPFSELFQRRQ